jgi:hypothetical protein
MNASTIHTLHARVNNNELNFMVFGFGYFLVRILSEYEYEVDDSLIKRINTIIDDINAATSSDGILAATVEKEDSLWQIIYIGPRGELQIADYADQAKADYQPFYVADFETKGVPLRSRNIPAHIIQYLCYGAKGVHQAFRQQYTLSAKDSMRSIAALINACRGGNEDETVVLPISPSAGNIGMVLSTTLAADNSKLSNTQYLCILNEFLTAGRQLYKKTIFIFAFAGLVILSLAIIAAANIISWANLIKIALLSSITAKAGISAAGIVIGGILLFLANRLRYKKNIFVCPCDEFCRKHCARGEDSEGEPLILPQTVSK